MTRYCSSCGRSIPNDARLCPYCGKAMALHEGLMIYEQEEEKKDKDVLKIVAILIILLIVVPAAATVYIYVSGMLRPMESMRYIDLEQVNNTLVVVYVYPSGLKWDEVEVSSGIATLPYGTITKGDIITNCEGTVILKWKSSNKLIGIWIFSQTFLC